MLSSTFLRDDVCVVIIAERRSKADGLLMALPYIMDAPPHPHPLFW